MKNEALYNKTIDILVQAYLNDTLKHGDCTACAVGNICAGNGVPRITNGDLSENGYYNNGSWKSLFYTNEQDQEEFPFGKQHYAVPVALRVVGETGYTVDELAAVEYAFEAAPVGKSDDEWMFNGLMAVINVLDQIHENTDEQVTANQKSRFSKATN